MESLDEQLEKTYDELWDATEKFLKTQIKK